MRLRLGVRGVPGCEVPVGEASPPGPLEGVVGASVALASIQQGATAATLKPTDQH